MVFISNTTKRRVVMERSLLIKSYVIQLKKKYEIDFYSYH